MIKEKIKDLIYDISYFFHESEGFATFIFIMLSLFVFWFSSLIFKTDNILFVSLYNILQIPVIFLNLCAFARTLQWLICKIFKRNKRFKFKIFNTKNKGFLYEIAVFTFLTLNILTFLNSNCTKDGIYCYNVSVTSSSGTYTLPAEIEVKSDLRLGNQHIGQKFYLNRFYWPNGGSCYFSDNTNLSFNDYMEYIAQDGRSYMVRLTKEKAEHEEISEGHYETDTPLNTLYIIFFGFGTLMSSAYFFKDNVLTY